MNPNNESPAEKGSKMKAALELLQNQQKKISTIAKELGYSSSGHFSYAFKRVYGTTPSAFRKKQSGEKTFEERIKWLGRREVRRLQREWNMI